MTTTTTELDRWYNRARVALYRFNKDTDPDPNVVELVMDALREGESYAYEKATTYIYCDMSERDIDRWVWICGYVVDENDEVFDNPSILSYLPTYKQPLYLLALLMLTGTGKKTDLKYRDMLLGMATALTRNEVIQESLTIAMTQTLIDAFTVLEPWQKGLVLTELRWMCEEKVEGEED